jgi:hypothetical protein
MRPGPEWLFEPEIFFPVEFDNLCVKDLAVMKCHPLAQRHLQRAVIEPTPTGGQDRYQRALLAEFNEVLEDVQHNILPVHARRIDNVQFPSWCWRLCPNTHGAPPTGDEHQDDAPNDKLFHGCSSLVALVEPLLSRSEDR